MKAKSPYAPTLVEWGLIIGFILALVCAARCQDNPLDKLTPDDMANKCLARSTNGARWVAVSCGPEPPLPSHTRVPMTLPLEEPLLPLVNGGQLIPADSVADCKGGRQ
jgi:hypothetical protein